MEGIVKDCRTSLGISVEKAAEIMGVSVEQYQRYEAGQSSDISTAQKVKFLTHACSRWQNLFARMNKAAEDVDNLLEDVESTGQLLSHSLSDTHTVPPGAAGVSRGLAWRLGELRHQFHKLIGRQ